MRISKNSIVGATFSRDEKLLHLLNVEGNIISYNTETESIESELTIKEVTKGIACIDGFTVVTLYESLLVKSEKGNILKEEKLKFKANCVEYNHLTKELYVGDSEVSFIH